MKGVCRNAGCGGRGVVTAGVGVARGTEGPGVERSGGQGRAGIPEKLDKQRPTGRRRAKGRTAHEGW